MINEKTPEVLSKAESKVAPQLTIAGAVDEYGKVTVWDHGPQPPDAAEDSGEYKAYEAQVEAWETTTAGMPQPVVMDATTAAQAISSDPVRYTLEPVGLDEGEVAEKVKKIQDARDAKAKIDAARVEAAQLAADRKIAIAELVTEHTAKLKEERAEAAHKRRRPLPKTAGKPAAPGPLPQPAQSVQAAQYPPPILPQG